VHLISIDGRAQLVAGDDLFARREDLEREGSANLPAPTAASSTPSAAMCKSPGAPWTARFEGESSSCSRFVALAVTSSAPNSTSL
jgi:hypothetical protein